jgi:hypothetical protein
LVARGGELVVDADAQLDAGVWRQRDRVIAALGVADVFWSA